MPTSSPAECKIKRGFDIVFSSAVLVVLLPLFVLIALVVASDGGPVFFAQQRVGQNGKIFICYKFRSMCVGADTQLQEYLSANTEMAEHWKAYQKLPLDERETVIGKILRRLALDELPQFCNVLFGDMSVVGPRPMLPEQREDYGDMTYYNKARPGITGLWQVSGRNQLTFAERAQLDKKYVSEWNHQTDAVILLKTVPAMIKAEG